MVQRMTNLSTGYYIADGHIALQWYATREAAEKSLTKYSAAGWRVVPAADFNQKGAKQ